MEEPITYLGVAITPEALEVEIGGQSYLTLNGMEGHARLLGRLGELTGVVRIVCERAGGAEIALVRALHEGGFTVGLAAPAEVCAFTRLGDASEITPCCLVRYAAAHPDRVNFIEGSRTPQISVSRVSGRFVSRPSRAAGSRGVTWTRIARWLTGLNPVRRRRAR